MPYFPRTLTVSMLSLLLLLWSSQSAYVMADEIDEAGNLINFAESLMEEEDYYRAITEYKRFLSYFPDEERTPLCRLHIAIAYKKGGKIDLAVDHLQQIRVDYAGTDLDERAFFEIGSAYFQSRQYEKAVDLFSEFIKSFPQSTLLDQGQISLGWSLLHVWEPDQAAKTFSMVRKENPYYSLAQELADELKAGVVLSKKSPVLAGVFSAVIPGSGQFYTRRYNEGVTSFVLNGAFIWAVVELFDRSSEVAGLILGFFETGWYSGGIFGAVNGAHKYNRKVQVDTIEALQNRYPQLIKE